MTEMRESGKVVATFCSDEYFSTSGRFWTGRQSSHKRYSVNKSEKALSPNIMCNYLILFKVNLACALIIQFH